MAFTIKSFLYTFCVQSLLILLLGGGMTQVSAVSCTVSSDGRINRGACIASCKAQNCATGNCNGQTCVCSRCSKGR